MDRWQFNPTKTFDAGLRIYDVSVDEYRDPTQEDLDQLVAVSQAYGRVRRLMDKWFSATGFEQSSRTIETFVEEMNTIDAELRERLEKS